MQAGNDDGQWTTNGPTDTVDAVLRQLRRRFEQHSIQADHTANVIAGNGVRTTQPVTVKTDTGNATVNIDAQQGDIISGGGNVTVTIPSIPGVSNYTLGIPVAYLTTPGGGSLT